MGACVRTTGRTFSQENKQARAMWLSIISTRAHIYTCLMGWLA